MADFSRIAKTTIQEYIKGAEAAILRNRKLLSLLKKRGRIKMNCSGAGVEWRARFRRNAVSGFADMAALDWQRNDNYKIASLPIRGYVATETISEFEQVQNRGPQAIINLMDTHGEHLVEDLSEYFAEELYVDGNATGNERRLHGLESFGGVTSISSSTPRIAPPSDTYAGLSTVLGAAGGAWTSGTGQSWPDGSGDVSYDFWSPVIVNTTEDIAGGWPSATKTFAANADEQLRFGLITAQRNNSSQTKIDVVLLDRGMYRDFLDSASAKERIQVNRGKESDLVSLGFTDVTNFDGTDVTWEYGIPQVNGAAAGYGVSLDAMELRSYYPTMFKVDGPNWDKNQLCYTTSARFIGNLKCASPRHFVRWSAHG